MVVGPTSRVSVPNRSVLAVASLAVDGDILWLPLWPGERRCPLGPCWRVCVRRCRRLRNPRVRARAGGGKRHSGKDRLGQPPTSCGSQRADGKRSARPGDRKPEQAHPGKPRFHRCISDAPANLLAEERLERPPGSAGKALRFVVKGEGYAGRS